MFKQCTAALSLFTAMNILISGCAAQSLTSKAKKSGAYLRAAVRYGAEPKPADNLGSKDPQPAAPQSPSSIPVGPVSDGSAIAMAAQDAAAHQADNQVRYISLGHLKGYQDAANSISGNDLITVRKAVDKLLNSLSWRPDLTSAIALDREGLLLKIKLSDYGWSPGLWDQLTTAYPTIKKDVSGYLELVKFTKTTNPVIRADWLIKNLSVPPLYYAALSMPSDFNALQQKLGVDIAADVRANRVIRAGFDNSLVSSELRVIERHALASGGFLWRSYEFSSKTGNENVMDFPLGPRRYLQSGLAPNNSRFFNDAGGEVFFTLPNGLLAFYITDGNNKRIDSVPGAKLGPVLPGQSCMSCHAHGPFNKADQVSDNSGKNKQITEAELNNVSKIYIPAAKFADQTEVDRSAYQTALSKINITASDADPISAVMQMPAPAL